jgi:uncharacterized protein (DUF885 family)
MYCVNMLRHSRLSALVCTIVFLCPLQAHAGFSRPQLDALSDSFWQWRATEQPFTDDDIPRIERAPAFVVDWSPAAAKRYQAQIAGFEKQWRALDMTGASVPDQIDYRLLGSAIARVYWELDVVPDWCRNPGFYVEQSLGSVYTLLLPPPPFQPERQQQILDRLERIPATLISAKENLNDMRAPYMRVTLDSLQNIEARLQKFKLSLAPELSPGNRPRFETAVGNAQSALVSYREWLQRKAPGLPEKTAVGRERYLYFLRNVALLPYTPEQMLTMSRQEWARTVAFESLSQAANTGTPQTPIFPSLNAQLADSDKQELAIREYLVSHGILSVPSEIKHYYYRAEPAYIVPLAFLGVTDDLTGPSRLDQDSSSYKRPPTAHMAFFDDVTARDNRPLMIHEGVPGHYFQLAWSWHHPDPIRRHYYDSESNEGIGFYAEEMMLQAGLFDSEPRTRESIYSMMRLRALRVEVDVRLALGEFTLEQAANYLASTVPMDMGTARGEASMFASTPGQAITYQIGKLDIIRMLSDARRKQGDSFRLQTFHDFVWLNGNLPFSLQRWQMLDDPSDVPPIPLTFSWSNP